MHKYLITQIHMANDNDDDITGIAEYEIKDTETGTFLRLSKEDICNQLLQKTSIHVYVNTPPKPEAVPVQAPNGGYCLRSEPDYTKKDNLLALPRY